MNNLATHMSFRVLVAETMTVNKNCKTLVFIHVKMTAVNQAVPTITDRSLTAHPNEFRDCVLK
jgi:hypothetical protein